MRDLLPKPLRDCFTLAGYALRHVPHIAFRAMGGNYQLACLSRIYSREDPWSYHVRAEERMRHDLVLASIPLREFRSILELGCSEGVFTRRLAERFAGRPTRIVGIDAIEVALERASQHCREYLDGENKLRFVQSNLESYRFDREFDLVIAMDVLYHLKSFSRLSLLRDRIIQGLAPRGLILLEHGLRSDAVEKRFQRIARRFCWSTAAIHTAFSESQDLTLVDDRIQEVGDGWKVQISLLQKRDP